MKRAALACVVLFAAAANAAAMERTALGTSAAVDGAGRIWVAYAQPAGQAGQVVLQRSDDNGATWQSPVRVNAVVEPVAAEGENRPKLAFGSARRNVCHVDVADFGAIHRRHPLRALARRRQDLVDADRRASRPATHHASLRVVARRCQGSAVGHVGRQARSESGGGSRASVSGCGDLLRALRRPRCDLERRLKLADSSCECCRIALASDSQGRVVAMWRHVFEPNERDHAFAFLRHAAGQGRTRDGRSLARRCVSASRPVAGFRTRRHASRGLVQSSRRPGSRVLRTTLEPAGRATCRSSQQARRHADLAVAGRNVAVAWKRFDGTVTKIESLISNDAGRSFAPGPSLQTAGDSDQPRLVKAGERILVVWRNADGIAVEGSRRAARRFRRSSRSVATRWRQSSASMRAASSGWCCGISSARTACSRSSNMAAAQRNDPQLKIVTISTDPIQSAAEIACSSCAARREIGGICVRRCAARSVAVRNRRDVARRKTARISLRRRRQTRGVQRSDTTAYVSHS